LAKYLTKQQILDAQDLETKEVEVPEWGGTVLVKTMTGVERDAFESSVVKGKGKNTTVNMANIRAKLVAASIVDQDGQRLFDDQDVQALGKKSAAALDRVFGVAQKLSKISQDDVEELAKNLPDDLSDNSGLD
jgi:hypothetical protein